jgi:NAD(P)-dependent dehydrogenase (short-subunit alcohol dehydrogenase family)
MACRALDVTNAAEQEAAVGAAASMWGGVDVLVNNAGVSYRAALEEMTEADERLQQAVNYLGPMALTRLVLPGMRAHRWGRIVNVSSVSGMMAMPTMGSYSASKWALEGASEALWYEMRPWGVRVTLVQPGFIRSDSFEHVLRPGAAHGEDLPADRSAYAAYYRHMAPFIARLMRRATAKPDDVARKIISCALRRKPPLRQAVTFDARFFYLMRRLLPRALYHAALYRALPGVSEWAPEPPASASKPTL